MSADAEKVINLSLCKMAESRGIRRGGSSLHKHLLITSVLTKARSAYFENWYLGDNDCSSVNNGALLSSLESTTGGSDDQLSLNQMLDPSFFVEVESDIELPSDILNCVEKLGDMSEMHIGFNVVSDNVDLRARLNSEEADMLGEGDNQVTSTTDMIQGDAESGKSRRETQMTYTYLDLDSSNEVPSSLTTEPVPANSLPSLFSTISNPMTHQSTTKRRRGWSFELENDSDDEEEEEETCSASPDLKDKLKLNTHGHVAKRMRSAASTDFNEVFSSGSSDSSTSSKLAFNFEENNFRTKKAHFEVEEEDETPGSGDADTFLDDEDDWCEGKGKESDRNDRRVPSASSSSSDEEQESGSCSMEVDQITSLVQYFSFQKQQQGNSAPARLATTATTSSQSQLSNLNRSMSSPDLCGRSGNTSSNGNTKDLFTSYGLTSSHRILTMKV